MTLLGPSAPGMAFMMKKKKYKFNVELTLEELVEVALVNEVLFAKVRLLDGGSFQEYSNREEVKDHTVKWNKKFEFLCKMSANASTGVLDQCLLRVSIRKELKGGRSYYKLGFIDVNLAEFAGSGLQSRRFLLEGYDQRHRLDNSMLRISIKLHMLSGDILFKAPSPSLKSKQISSQDDLASVVVSSASNNGPGSVSTPSLTGLQTPTGGQIPNVGIPLSTTTGLVNINTIPIVSNRAISNRDETTILSNTNTISSQSSSGFGSLTKKKSDTNNDIMDPNNILIASIITDSGLSECSEQAGTESIQSCPPPIAPLTGLPHTNINNAQHVNVIGNSGMTGGSAVAVGTGTIMELGHSRNSSNTSQMSKGSGYSSFSHSQHSRQSSEGDSGHARYSKTVILSKWNQRAANMKLNLKTFTHHHQIKCTKQDSSDIIPVSATIDSDGYVYVTPNSTLLSSSSQEYSIEEFRTPSTELPNNKYLLHTPPSPTSKYIKSSQISPIHLLSPNNLPGLLEMSDCDSGLDENFHTPRGPKIKSMENLTIIEMNSKRTSTFDQYSPRRLSCNYRNSPKIKSLNNLVFEVQNELTEVDPNAEEKEETPNIFQKPLPKFVKLPKIGNAKFIGNDEETILEEKNQFPIAKIKSMGTIPDIVAERVKYEPFLTPTQNRKQFIPMHIGQNANQGNDCVDGNKFQANIKKPMRIIGEHTSLHEFNEADYAELRNYCPDIFGKTNYGKGYQDLAYTLLNTPTQTDYRRSYGGAIKNGVNFKSSTPLRPSNGLDYYINSDNRPKSSNNFYPQQDCVRSISGVPRRLLDNSQRQLSLVTTGCGQNLGNNISPNSSSATLNSIANNSLIEINNDNLSCKSNSTSNASSLLIINSQSGQCAAGENVINNTSTSVSLSPSGNSQQIRRPSITMNPSSGSLVLSETGSLDRMKTAAEKRKKAALEDNAPQVTDRVEKTRINADSLIDEILKDTKLDQLEESAETSGLQLFIGRDGTASLGSHEVKSRVSAGAFKQVVMEAPR